MKKLDLKKLHRDLFNPPIGSFVEVVVPEFSYIMVDGKGDPNTTAAYKTAVEWLYGVSYAMKFAAKNSLSRDYVVPPLEGLWWSDDPETFVRREKDRWSWTMMIMAPDFVTATMFDDGVAKTQIKRSDQPKSLRFENYEEGLSLQTMHVGSYDDEGPTLMRLHDEIMPEMGVSFSGAHHEIYLSDPRKTVPGKLRTILRQPIK